MDVLSELPEGFLAKYRLEETEVIQLDSNLSV